VEGREKRIRMEKEGSKVKVKGKEREGDYSKKKGKERARGGGGATGYRRGKEFGGKGKRRGEFCTEPEIVILLRSLGIDSKPGRNFLVIDSWAPSTFTNLGSGDTVGKWIKAPASECLNV
jgi:hypothetical protein